MNSKNYNRSDLDLDLLKVRKLENLSNLRPWADVIILYLITIIIVFSSHFLTTQINYIFYPMVIFLIAGRQGALLQLVHEASHGLINKNIKINNFFGSWITSYLIGVNYQGYTSAHQSHHANTSTDKEPISDQEKYSIVDFKNPKIYLLFLKDILGLTALKVFFNYGSDKSKKKNNLNLNKYDALKSRFAFLIKMSFVQLFIFALFNFDIINYFLFWIYPAMGPHMFLMRIRGIAEHGLPKKLGVISKNSNEGRYYTRSFLTQKNYYNFKILTLAEKFLIGSYSVHYHHEHHLNAKIPYYNLKKFHKLVSEKVLQRVKPENNSVIYEKGYFSAALSKAYLPKEIIT